MMFRHAIPGSRRRWLFAAALSALLAACASGPGIPDTTYYRMPRISGIEPLPVPLTQSPIVVSTFLADGIHSDQALLYAMDDDAMRLRAYHYQLWVDPPTRMLQRRLISTLRRARVAPLVVDTLPSPARPARVDGRVIALERVPSGAGWTVHVALGLRYDPPADDTTTPSPLVRVYREELPVDDGSVAQSAQRMGEAVDRIFARFIADLQAQQAAATAQR